MGVGWLGALVVSGFGLVGCVFLGFGGFVVSGFARMVGFM